LPNEVVSKLNDIGKWTAVNGKALYSSRITTNYHNGDTWFTQSKDGKFRYALYCIDANKPMPGKISWTANTPKKGTAVTLLSSGKKVMWKETNGTTTIQLPADITVKNIALALEFKPAN